MLKLRRIALCARCGHPRGEHYGTFGAARRGCRAREFDVQSLDGTACACEGYLKRDGDLADAPFAEPQELPPLRVVPLD